jgi:hypothetical protein
MRRLVCQCLLGAGIVSLLAFPAHADAPPALRRPGALSDRILTYRISATLDPDKHTVTGHEHVTWRNAGTTAAPNLQLHLYMNAFKNESSVFFKESRAEGGSLNGGGPVDDGEWGAIDVSSFKVDDGTGPVDVLGQSTVDDTVMTVNLPQPVMPQQTISMDIDFVTTLPRVVARAGYMGDFYLVGQWYPELGVWENRTWNCHYYHSTSEFYADFGVYDVDVTTPAGWPVGATGVEIAEKSDANTVTRSFHAEDVHDFVWTTAPFWKELDGTFTDEEPAPVNIRVLYPPGADEYAARHLTAAQAALGFYGSTFFPYPYSTLTVVDVPIDAGDAGGMEYPTFFTTLDADRGSSPITTAIVASDTRSPEYVTMHEFGHQYFAMMVASNEFEEAWLDEGLTEYTSSLALEDTYGPGELIDVAGLRFGAFDLDRTSYLALPNWDPMETKAWLFADSSSYGAVSYGKTTTLMHTLERWMGRDRVLGALRQYAVKFAFKHPHEQDFEAAMSAGVGEDLSFIFSPTIDGTGTLDYEVSSVESEEHTAPAGLFDDQSGHRNQVSRSDAEKAGRDANGNATWDSQVLLHRVGDIQFPVEVVVHFDDGSEDHTTWDGKDRWKRLAYEGRPARAIEADLDPEHKLWLDADMVNNGLSAEPSSDTTSSFSQIVSFAEETLLQAVGL